MLSGVFVYFDDDEYNFLHFFQQLKKKVSGIFAYLHHE